MSSCLCSCHSYSMSTPSHKVLAKDLPIHIFLWSHGVGYLLCVNGVDWVQGQLNDEAMNCRILIDRHYATQHLQDPHNSQDINTLERGTFLFTQPSQIQQELSFSLEREAVWGLRTMLSLSWGKKVLNLTHMAKLIVFAIYGRWTGWKIITPAGKDYKRQVASQNETQRCILLH